MMKDLPKFPYKGSEKKIIKKLTKENAELKRQFQIIFNTGEFAYWLKDKQIPWAAMKEIVELETLIKNKEA